MSSAIPQYRRVWRQFLETYISMPCLWQVHCPDYGNREKRDECYYKLAEMCRQIEPTANKEFVLKKINCYRTTFRKELKKAQDALRKGTHYEPTLWYYRILLPVAEQQPSQPVKTEDLSGLDGYDCDASKAEAMPGGAGALRLSADAVFGDEEVEGGCEKEEEDDEGMGAAPECESVLTERFASSGLQDGNPFNAGLVHAALQQGLRPKRRRLEFDYVSVGGGGASAREEDAAAAAVDDGLRWRPPPSPPPPLPPPQPPAAPPPPPRSLPTSPQRQEDAFDFVGRNVAAKLRALAQTTPLQAIVAEKLISDVLFHAQLDSLTCAARVVASAVGDVSATTTAEASKATKETTNTGERGARSS